MSNIAAITQVKCAIKKLTAGMYMSSYEAEIEEHLRLALICLGPAEIIIHEEGEQFKVEASTAMRLAQIGLIDAIEELDDGNYELASGATMDQIIKVIAKVGNT